MGKKGRGREGLVRCEKCGCTTRRDKAVFIEKPMLMNPLDRNQVTEPDAYRRTLYREVCYCISCGKHGRIFEKKKQQNERLREREREWAARGGQRRNTSGYGDGRDRHAVPGRTSPQASGQPTSQAPATQPAPAQESGQQSQPQAEESEVPQESAGQ